MEEIYKFKAKIKSDKTSMTKSFKESDEILEKFSKPKLRKPQMPGSSIAAHCIKSLETAKQKLAQKEKDSSALDVKHFNQMLKSYIMDRFQGEPMVKSIPIHLQPLVEATWWQSMVQRQD